MNPLFKRRAFSGVGFCFFVFLSVLMLFLDNHTDYFKKPKAFLSFFVVPFQYFVSFPFHMLDWAHYNIASRQALIDENTKLRYQHLMLQARLQKFIALKKENTQLRTLLQSTTLISGKVMAAQLLGVNPMPFSQTLLLDKGKQEDIRVGQPVLDAYGIMGQVIKTYAKTSIVLLITDPKSAVPVQVNRTGERGILVGNDTVGSLSLHNLPKTADVRLGDVLVTSGLGTRFPEGYPIGKVTRVDNARDDMFTVVEVVPLAHLNKSRVVLLLWPIPRLPLTLTGLPLSNDPIYHSCAPPLQDCIFTAKTPFPWTFVSMEKFFDGTPFYPWMQSPLQAALQSAREHS